MLNLVSLLLIANLISFAVNDFNAVNFEHVVFFSCRV